MKILLSAYACEAGKGSEPEVGLQAMLAAASKHDVWVLTRQNNLESLRSLLRTSPLVDRIHLEGLDVPGRALRIKKRGIVPLHWYYDLWQRRAAARAEELDRSIQFDLVHHVSFAAYWSRAGVSWLDRPLVWGPVGGGVNPPLSLARELGWKGVGSGLVRVLTRPTLGRLLGVKGSRRSAVLVLAQNRETARRLSSYGNVWILPNATSISVPVSGPTSARRKDVAFVGRLIPWKGGTLAVRALRYVQDPDVVLRIYGEGPDRSRIAHAASRMGVSERVVFRGLVSRDLLLSDIRGAGALLHVALQEESGLAMAEALSVGTPVVCLDRGGPSELVSRWPSSPATMLPPDRPERTARRVAAALDGYLSNPPSIPDAPTPSEPPFAEELLRGYEQIVRAG